MRVQAIAALSVILLCSAFAAGMRVERWRNDSVALAVEDTRKAVSVVIAGELAKQKRETTVINQRVIERTRSERVYLECNHSPEMVELINSALR